MTGRLDSDRGKLFTPSTSMQPRRRITLFARSTVIPLSAGFAARCGLACRWFCGFGIASRRLRKKVEMRTSSAPCGSAAYGCAAPRVLSSNSRCRRPPFTVWPTTASRPSCSRITVTRDFLVLLATTKKLRADLDQPELPL